MTIITIISIITILRIVICFQRRHESTVKRIGPGVGLCGGREKEQNPCVPNWIWRDHESTICNTWRPNHNEVQLVAAVKWFCRERVAVNPLHTIVQVWPSTKQLYSAKWPLSWAESFNSKVSSSAFTWKIIAIMTITSIIETITKRTCPQFSCQN